MSKSLSRAETRKLHPWWWDSHISPKNTKWMAEKMEEMDSSVKRMLKLIEGEGDSFAKKADMYYQKRPELVSLVEDFHRMYRSLAERYNHLTGELRKNIPSELQSQNSGTLHRKNTHRAAGFDFFLGSAGGSSSDLTQKDVEHSSSDSDLDSDTSSVNNYSAPADGEVLDRRVIELEIELHDAKERLEGNREGGNSKNITNNIGNSHYEKLLAKIAGYEDQLRIANRKLKLAEEEIGRLKLDYNSQAQPELAQKDIQVVETDNRSEEGGRSFDLQEQIVGLETSVSVLDSGSLEFELENDRRSSLEEGTTYAGLERITEADILREEISKIIQSSSAEKERLEAEISKVTEERAQVESKLRDWESRGKSMEEEMEGLKAGITQRGEDVEALNKELDALKLKYEMLVAERDGLNEKVKTMMADASRRDNEIEKMEEHMKRLHMEQMGLVAGAEMGRKMVEELGGKVRELKEEVERQRMTISNGEEEKREAIRQLCFSLDHYRNGYQQLRRAFVVGNHKRHSVLAS